MGAKNSNLCYLRTFNYGIEGVGYSRLLLWRGQEPNGSYCAPNRHFIYIFIIIEKTWVV